MQGDKTAGTPMPRFRLYNPEYTRHILTILDNISPRQKIMFQYNSEVRLLNTVFFFYELLFHVWPKHFQFVRNTNTSENYEIQTYLWNK